jgi:protein-disulfide isomerase
MKHHLVFASILIFASAACAQQPSQATSAGSEVVARYDDQVITESELEDAAKAQLVSLRQQEYEIKRQQLEQTIFERLMDRAAAAAGVTSSEYMNQQVMEKVAEPSEEEIAKVLAQYRSRLNPDDAKAREQVVGYLKQQQQAQLNKDLKERLFREANVQILLEPMRFEAVITPDTPSRGGGPDAPVTLIEYTDFQCPFCSRVQPTLVQIQDRYGDLVRHVFKQLPLPMHPQARIGAEASLCAAAQGKFWEMHDWLFAHKDQINRDAMVEQVKTMGMDPEAFGSCLDANTFSARIDADSKEARSFGITGTPGFLINGIAVRGAQPLEEFERIIDSELQSKGIAVPEKKAEAGAEAKTEG